MPEAQLQQCVGQVVVEAWSKFASDTWLSGDCAIFPPPECGECCDRLADPSVDFDTPDVGPCRESGCQSQCSSIHRLQRGGIAFNTLADEMAPDRRTCVREGVLGALQRLRDRLSARIDEEGFLVRVPAWQFLMQWRR